MTASSASTIATGGWGDGGVLPWVVSFLAMLLLHAGLLAAAVLWHPSFDRAAPPAAALMIELAPLAAPVPPRDLAPGIEQQEARPIEREREEESGPAPVVKKVENLPPEPPGPEIKKVEEMPPAGKAVERTIEPVRKKAEVALPRPKPRPRPKPPAKKVEKAPPVKKPVERISAPMTTAVPDTEQPPARPIGRKIEDAPPAEQAAERTTAPVAAKAPPATRTAAPVPGLPSAAPGKAVLTWQAALRAHLENHKRYPAAAQFHRQEGMATVRFSMTRDGRVAATRLERSSGYSRLDDEALALPARAQPLPSPPPEIPGKRIEIVVPIRFFLR